MIENLDAKVGKIMDAIESQGLADRTITVLLSDHGEMAGAHGSWAKVQPYEESIGIPLIVAGPGVPAARLDPLVSTKDLFPTLLGLMGLAPRASVPGCDLAPVIRGSGSAPERPGVMLEMVWEQVPGAKFHRQIWRGFRSRRYKYTVIGDLESGLRPWQWPRHGWVPFPGGNDAVSFHRACPASVLPASRPSGSEGGPAMTRAFQSTRRGSAPSGTA